MIKVTVTQDLRFWKRGREMGICIACMSQLHIMVSSVPCPDNYPDRVVTIHHTRGTWWQFPTVYPASGLPGSHEEKKLNNSAQLKFETSIPEKLRCTVRYYIYQIIRVPLYIAVSWRYIDIQQLGIQQQMLNTLECSASHPLTQTPQNQMPPSSTPPPA